MRGVEGRAGPPLAGVERPRRSVLSSSINQMGAGAAAAHTTQGKGSSWAGLGGGRIQRNLCGRRNVWRAGDACAVGIRPGQAVGRGGEGRG